jgi:hypothetical protein
MLTLISNLAAPDSLINRAQLARALASGGITGLKLEAHARDVLLPLLRIGERRMSVGDRADQMAAAAATAMAGLPSLDESALRALVDLLVTGVGGAPGSSWRGFTNPADAARAALAEIVRRDPTSRSILLRWLTGGERRSEILSVLRVADVTDPEVFECLRTLLQDETMEDQVLSTLLPLRPLPPAFREDLLALIAKRKSQRAIDVLAQHFPEDAARAVADIFPNQSGVQAKFEILEAVASNDWRDGTAFRALGKTNANVEDWLLDRINESGSTEEDAERALMLMGDLGSAKEQTLLTLEKLAQSNRPASLRRRAIRTLGMLDTNGTRMRVFAALAANEIEMRQEAILALEAAKSPLTPEAWQVIAAAVSDEEEPLRSIAAEILRKRSVETAPWSDSELLHWLESYDSAKRLAAEIILGARKPLAKTTRDEVMALRSDKRNRPWVQLSALRTLIEIEVSGRSRDSYFRWSNDQ